jgi:D-threo-aldose 1-dehydrogenase
MEPHAKHQVGDTPFKVPRLGMGGASLGDMHRILSEDQARATIEAAHDAGVGYFDTSPWYGNTKSELRLGGVLRQKPRDSFVLSTKVGRVHRRPPNPDSYSHPTWAGGLAFEPRFDYTRAGVTTSFEMSAARLGLNRIEALLIHDLDPGHHGSSEAVDACFDQLDTGGGYAALAELKSNGEIYAVGAGVNRTGMIAKFLERFPIDFFLVAMPYTLLDQRGLAELDLCAERGVSVVIGSPFASGILARDAGPETTYGYRRANPKIIERAQRIRTVTERHGVPLGAAALQFPFGHPSVVSVIPGPVSPEEVAKNLEWICCDIPGDLWEELRAEALVELEVPLLG